MSTEANKATARRFIEEVWNGGQLAVIDELVLSAYVDHDPNNPLSTEEGPEGVKQSVTIWRTAFPDVQVTVEGQIAEGDMVVTRWRAHGTHRGTLLGIPPTGRQVSVTGVFVERYQDGQIAESWTEFDALGLLQQLGAVPPLGAQR